MRFCMVTTFYPPYHFGGDAIFIQQLSNELAKRDHHVEVIHCKDAFNFMTDRQPTAVCEDHPNVRVHTLESPVGAIWGDYVTRLGNGTHRSSYRRGLGARRAGFFKTTVPEENAAYCGHRTHGLCGSWR